MTVNGTTDSNSAYFDSTSSGYDVQYDSNIWSNISCGNNSYSPSGFTGIFYPDADGTGYPYGITGGDDLSSIISYAIQRADASAVAGSTHVTGKEIYFNRSFSNSYIEFSNFGAGDPTANDPNLITGNLVDSYLTSVGIGSVQQGIWGYDTNENTDQVTHDSCFAGDEIHVEVRLGCYRTMINDGDSTQYNSWRKSAANFGRNHIQPMIQLLDGNTIIGSSASLDSGIINPNFTGTYYGTTITGIPTAAELANGDITADWDNDGGSRASTFGDITPYNCFHSTPFGGSDGDEGYSTGTWSDQPLNFVDADGWQISGSRTFSSTKTSATNDYAINSAHRFFVLGPGAGTPIQKLGIFDDWYMWAPTSVTEAVAGRDDGGVVQRDYIVSFSVKLREYSDTDAQALAYDPGDPIKKVVDNLTIRIQNDEPELSGDWYPSTTWNRFGKPLWKIKDIKIKKGFSVLQANEEEIGNTIIDTHGVAPVPPVDIPTWVETNHNYFSTDAYPNMWTFTTDAVGSGNTFTTSMETPGAWGSNRAITPNFNGGIDANGYPINYSLPEGFSFSHNGNTDGEGNLTIWDPADYTSLNNYGGIVGAAGPNLANAGMPNLVFNRESASNNSYSLLEINSASWIDITSSSSTAASDIMYGIGVNPGSEWTLNNWYLVDVEYENFIPGTDPGELLIYGVAPIAGFVDDGVINEEGVGLWRGDDPATPTIAHCKLVPTLRTEYGVQKTVLRGIFKIASDSWVKDNDPNKFTLRILGCTNGIRITKIIPKNLTEVATPGSVDNDDWIIGAPSTSSPTHSFSDSIMYYTNDKLCWELPADAGGISIYHTWSQDLANVSTFHQGPWELTFTVSDNPMTNNHSGSLGGVIAVSDTGVFRGVAFNGIEDPGNYKISFDFTDNSDGSGWAVYKDDGFGEFDTYSGASTETAIASSWTVTTAGNKIQFHQDLGETTAQEYAINNISLKPLEQTILVGNIGSWNINGFDINQVDPHIYLDNDNNYFVFDDCPIHDVNETQFISISQQVDEIVNQFDQYKISFNHGITTGEIGVYYYNNSGYGFKITGIDSSTSASFEQVITIGDPPTSGDGLWVLGQDGNIQNGIDYGPNDLDFDSDLKNTFVIVARDNGDINGINGWIDNISMVRVYTDEATADKTITFNEAVNGWSSFKSFVPENGVSLSKKYFTFKEGKLWQHYIPKLQGSTGSFDDNFFIKTTVEEADNYNEFYGVNNYSSIQAVINPEPSTVKVFNTINYEGSQAYISTPSASEITINNAAAWSSGGDIPGWECSEIKTNLDSGSVIEFIEKEGKWFNYIKGLNANQALDTSRFSVLGIGIVSSTQSII